MKEHITPEKIENDLIRIVELKAEGDRGAAGHFQRELKHEIKVAKRVNLKEVENN